MLTGLDLDKKDDLYDMAKSSLKKFLGEGCSGAGSGSGPAIKQEPVFWTGNSGNRGSYGRGHFGFHSLRSIHTTSLNLSAIGKETTGPTRCTRILSTQNTKFINLVQNQLVVVIPHLRTLHQINQLLQCRMAKLPMQL